MQKIKRIIAYALTAAFLVSLVRVGLRANLPGG